MGNAQGSDALFARTARLFAVPSCITGVSKLVDVGATFDEYNANETPKEADFWSLWSDWCAVGDDLRYAFSEHVSSLSAK